jgi:hypothetical protein
VDTLGRLFGDSAVPLQLAYSGAGSGGDDMQAVTQKAVADLEAGGCRATLGEALSLESSDPVPDLVKESGLLALALEKGVRKDAPQLAWLARISTPLLLVLV